MPRPTQIWEYAKANGFAIVSKDTDFRERSFVEGFPPKVILLDVGNVGTMKIAALLKENQAVIDEFIAATDESLLYFSTRGSEP